MQEGMILKALAGLQAQTRLRIADMSVQGVHICTY